MSSGCDTVSLGGGFRGDWEIVDCASRDLYDLHLALCNYDRLSLIRVFRMD